MASLLDTVNKNASALSAPSPASNPLLSATGLQPTTGEETQGTAQIAAVGQTGKALDTTGGLNTRLSSLGERLASVQALNQAKEVTKEAQLQGISLDQQQDQLQQQFQQSSTRLSEERIGMQEQFNTQLKGMMFEYKNQLKSLNLSRDKSRMEQMGFMLRMGNQEYMDKLQLEGRRARLDNAVSFNEALQQSIFADEMDLFSSSLEFRNYMYADMREAQKQLAEIDIEFALQVANADNQAASGQMMWSGVGNVLGAGLSYAAGNKSTPKTYEAVGGGVNPNLGVMSNVQGGLLEGVPSPQSPASPYTTGVGPLAPEYYNK